MFLRQATNKKTGRTYLSIVHSYRDKKTKTTKSETIKSIGYLDQLEKQYDDPIAYFTAEAKLLEEERRSNNADITLTFSKDETIPMDTLNRKNFGYAVLSKIYHDLKINTFINNKQRHTNEQFDANAIMKMLVFSRILFPASKSKTYEERERYFENSNYSLDDVYRCLTFLNKNKEKLQIWINDKIKQLYGRNTNLVYYDVTNYYFETDKTDDFRKKGVCKEHRPNPIVQMGLFIDNNGIPITYELFSGNTNDCLTFRPNFSRIKREYNLRKVVVVADKGMTTGDNIWYTLSAKDGYVFSMSIRGATKEIKDFVLKDEGYKWQGDDYKWKSRLSPRDILVTSTDNKKIKKTVHEKQVVFYSEKYAKRAKFERDTALAKANDLIRNPGKYTRATSQGAASYIKNIDFNKETGEILVPSKLLKLELDLEKIEEEEALDGYYLIITSEYKESSASIIEMYRGLWRIEESFRITKSDLEARPVYVSTIEHIEAHFLTCFVALVITRLLETGTERKYSIAKLIENLRKSECSYTQQNYYIFDYYTEVLKDIGEKFGIDFSKKILTLGEIKKIIGSTKK
jgi:transposase